MRTKMWSTTCTFYSIFQKLTLIYHYFDCYKYVKTRNINCHSCAHANFVLESSSPVLQYMIIISLRISMLCDIKVPMLVIMPKNGEFCVWGSNLNQCYVNSELFLPNLWYNIKQGWLANFFSRLCWTHIYTVAVFLSVLF